MLSAAYDLRGVRYLVAPVPQGENRSSLLVMTGSTLLAVSHDIPKATNAALSHWKIKLRILELKTRPVTLSNTIISMAAMITIPQRT